MRSSDVVGAAWAGLAFVLIGAWLSHCSSTVAAGSPPLRPVPAQQWTPDAHVWLARGMVAEAGWLNDRDHVAIAYVLARRWKRVTERYPTLRFLDVIRNYCAGLGAREAATARQLWVRALPAPDSPMDAPEGWPRSASWPQHRKLWRQVLQRAQHFAMGQLADPSRGRAWHWGSCDSRLPDLPRALRMIDAGRWVPLDIPGTRNCFYALAARGGGRS